MSTKATHISGSIDTLNRNLEEVAQVSEWAEKMGYQNTREFSRRFLRHYMIRPCKVLEYVRLESVYRTLRDRNYSNFQIARRHSLPDEKALNKFVKYHLHCSPSELKLMSEDQFRRQVKNSIVKFGSKVRE